MESIIDQNIYTKVIEHLKINSKIRSECSIKSFKRFLILFLKKYNITLEDMYNKIVSIKLTKEDKDFFIKGKPKTFIFYLAFICKHYFNIEFKANDEIKRYKETMEINKLKENNFKNEIKKEEGTPYLKNDELEKIYDSVTGYEKLFFLLLITTGMRKGAFLKCKYENINFEEEYITTIEKGNVETQYILNPEIINLIKEYPNFFKDFTKDCRMRKAFAQFKKILNKEDIYAHLFRFTFSRLVLNSLNNVKEIQTMLNHTNLQTTQTSYIKETRLDKMKRMNVSWLKKQEKILPYFMEAEHINKFYKTD